MHRKIWFITGISSGLGKALAERVISDGDFVVGTMRQSSQVQDFNNQFSGKAAAFRVELDDADVVAASMQTILAVYPRIDVLVNNAGSGFSGAVEETSLNEARRQMEIHYFATLEVTRAILPEMRHHRSGHIVQISSHSGFQGFAGFGAYAASKFALEGYSEALARELAPLGIRVTIVEPGPFRTDFAGRNLQEAADKIADYDVTSGAFRTRLRSVDGKQEGDPARAANVLVDWVKEPGDCLRLPLGKVALATIYGKLDSVRADLESVKSRAESVVFD